MSKRVGILGVVLVLIVVFVAFKIGQLTNDPTSLSPTAKVVDSTTTPAFAPFTTIAGCDITVDVDNAPIWADVNHQQEVFRLRTGQQLKGLEWGKRTGMIAVAYTRDGKVNSGWVSSWLMTYDKGCVEALPGGWEVVPTMTPVWNEEAEWTRIKNVLLKNLGINTYCEAQVYGKVLWYGITPIGDIQEMGETSQDQIVLVVAKVQRSEDEVMYAVAGIQMQIPSYVSEYFVDLPEGCPLDSLPDWTRHIYIPARVTVTPAPTIYR